MQVYGHTISEEQVQACLAFMRSGEPFTAKGLQEEAERLGVPGKVDRSRYVSYRLADRLLQREKRRGSIKFDNASRTWLSTGDLS